MSRPSQPQTSRSQSASVRYLTVGEEHHGQRLDNFLSRELKGAPKSLIYKALRRGEVRVNKGRSKPDRRLESGDEIRIPPFRLAEAGQCQPAAQAMLDHLSASILYEDKGVLVINKPAGLAVHGGSGVSLGLIEALRQLRPEAKTWELVHRLDRETSGCLLVAKRRSALRFLQQALRDHQVQKTYVALVKDRWPARRQRVAEPLEKYVLPSGERRVRVSRAGKEAYTDFKVLEVFERAAPPCTLVEASPITGRTHQIRVHALSVGCPLAGDDKYTEDEFNQQMKKYAVKRLFLHAQQLVFPLPPIEGQAQQIKTVSAELPEDLQRVLDQLKKAR